MKTCSKCKVSLQLTEFGIHKRDGHQSRCKSCKKLYQREWHRANKSTRLIQIKEYQKRKKNTLQEAINKLKDAPCSDCGNRFPPCAMDFDHRDATTKHKEISTMICRDISSLEKILIEVTKCDLVCACCHRIRTNLRKHTLI